jgi:hypothetical protein
VRRSYGASVCNGHGPAETVATLDNVLTTDQKGNIAEAAIVATAVKLGIDVYRPVGEGGRYDMIFEVDEHLIRVQCKWAPRHGDVVVLRCYSCRRNRDGLVRRKYVAGEIDAFAAYCPDTDSCYFLPFELFSGRSQVLLRLGRARTTKAWVSIGRGTTNSPLNWEPLGP